MRNNGFIPFFRERERERASIIHPISKCMGILLILVGDSCYHVVSSPIEMNRN